MPIINSSELNLRGPEFAIEVSGSLLGIDVISGKFLANIVDAIVTIASAPIKRIIISFSQTYADIELECTTIRMRARIDRLHITAKLYDEAISKADFVAWATPEIRDELKDVLMEDMRYQLRQIRNN